MALTSSDISNAFSFLMNCFFFLSGFGDFTSLCLSSKWPNFSF